MHLYLLLCVKGDKVNYIFENNCKIIVAVMYSHLNSNDIASYIAIYGLAYNYKYSFS